MHSGEIDELVQNGRFPCDCRYRETEETHISWVILCESDVFKIKKPIRYDFLDFSSLEKRKFYCQEEVRLNRRLARDMYIDTLSVTEYNGVFAIGGEQGNVVDYAVHMKRLPSDRRMDILLKQHRVHHGELDILASILSDFHSEARRYIHCDPDELLAKVNDIGNHSDAARKLVGASFGDLIDEMCRYNSQFIRLRTPLFNLRVSEGFCRECHGDLHSRNIFLLPEPVVFDCIEFSEDYRRLDILNEIGFMCMDLDAFGASELSAHFFNSYNLRNPVCRNADEYLLFLFFKAYRANVRAKVNILRAMSSAENKDQLREIRSYLTLMRSYLEELRSGNFSHLPFQR